MNKLINMYGCNLTKEGNKLKLTLVSGSKDNKEFLNCLIKNDDKFAFQLSKDKKSFLVKIPILVFNKKEEKKKQEKEDFEGIDID